MSWHGRFAAAVLVLAAAACSGADAVLVGNSLNAAGAALNPPVMRGIDGVPGWKRTGTPERYNKEGLYGYIDGGAEIVLEYGFRELSVQRFAPVAAGAAGREITLEIYRMTTGEAAFGLYSTKLEGGEKAWPGLRPDNWVGPGQGSFVKGDYLANVLAPDCGEKEVGEFLAAVAPRVPGRETARPKGMARLPVEGMVPSSGRYIEGPVAARNESPFLDGAFWGFAPAAGGKDASAAFSAKYGTVPAVSKLVVVELGPGADAEAVADGVFAQFNEYLQSVRRQDGMIEGRNGAGRWFLFKPAGALAALVFGGPDRESSVARLDAALAAAPAR